MLQNVQQEAARRVSLEKGTPDRLVRNRPTCRKILCSGDRTSVRNSRRSRRGASGPARVRPTPRRRDLITLERVTTATNSAVAAGGLTVDIAGAMLLALGLMFKKPRQAIEEASPKWSFNSDLEVSLASQTADAQAGGSLLILGFAIQLAAVLGWRESTWSDVGIAIGSGAALDAGVVWILFRWWRPWQLRRMLMARLATLDYGPWWPVLAAYGPHLGKPPPDAIAVEVTFAEYGEQLLGPKLWSKLVANRKLPDVLTKLRRDLAGTPEYEATHGTPRGS